MDSGSVFKRCGCRDQVTGGLLGAGCPRLRKPRHGSWYFSVEFPSVGRRGRLEKAYIALRAAEEIAHEEVAGRPSVRQLARELIASAPPGLRRDAAHFAVRAGVSR